MSNIINIKKKIGNFNKKIIIPGDKSLSIRWVLFASLANGTSKQKSFNVRRCLATIQAVKKLGIKVVINKNKCIIFEGLNGFKYKKSCNKCTKFRYVR